MHSIFFKKSISGWLLEKGTFYLFVYLIIYLYLYFKEVFIKLFTTLSYNLNSSIAVEKILKER